MRRIALALAFVLAATAALAQSGQFPAKTTWGNPAASRGQPKAMSQTELTSLINPSLDVFLLIGSSNTVGQGTSASSPIPPSTAVRYCYTGAVSAVADPMCSAVDASTTKNSQTGSMWPAFAIAYGRPVGLVLAAVSGSTQASACDFLVGNGNWQATTAGSNYANAITAINAALTAFTAAGYTPVFRGIIQNELGVNDAAQIDAAVAGCTQAVYTTAFNAMAANFRAATIGGTTYPHLPIYMSLSPSNSNAAFPDTPGYKQIRDAQLAIVASDGNTLMPYVGAVSFQPRGLMQTNSVHPTQAGYNEWGYALGGAVLPYIPHSVPFRLFNANAAGPSLLPTNVGVLQLVQKDAFSTPLVMDTYGTGANGIALRSALGTGAAPPNITNGANLGVFGVKGYGATGYLAANQGSFLCNATQDFTDAAAGTGCSIFTTPNGSVTPARSLGLFNGSSAVFGPLDAAAPTAQTISVQNVLTGTANTAGAATIIAASRGTGSAIGGSLSLQVAPAGGAGSTQNALASAVTILGNGNIGFGTETNPQFPFVYSLNSTTGATATGISAFNGPIAIGATGGAIGFVGVGIAGPSSNNFVRIDNTIASPSNLGTGEVLGSLNFSGWGSSALQASRAQINATTLEAWTTTFGIGLNFLTTAAGGSRAQSMALKGGVIVGAGTTDPGAGNLGFTNMALSGTAPTISAGFCATSPSIPANNGTVAFTINVGTACAGSVGTLGMPTAATGWVCDFHNVTNPATNIVEQTGGATNTVTLTNYVRTTGVAGNFTASDVIRAKCAAY